MDAVADKMTEMQGYKLHVIETDKYKTNTFIWKMKAPLSQEDITKKGAASPCFTKQFGKISIYYGTSFIFR